IQEFEKEYPNIKVTQAAFNNVDIFPKLMAALPTKTNPTMTFAPPDRAMAIWNMGYAQPHDELVKKIDEQHKYIPSARDMFFFDGHYWSVPTWTITLMLYYRKDLLKEAGFDEPPKTWDELLVMAEALTGNGQFGISIPASSGQNATDQVVWAFMSTNGAEVFDEEANIVFNNPKTIETYKFLKELLKYAPRDAISWGWGETKLGFTSGRCAMGILFGSVLQDFIDTTDFPDEVGAVLIPIPKGGKLGGYKTCESLMILEREDQAKIEASKKFIEFFFRPNMYGAALANMQPGLFLPITELGMQSEEFLKHATIARYGEIMNNMFKSVETSSHYCFLHEKRHPAAGKIGVSYPLAAVMQRIASDTMTVEQAVEWGQKMMEELAED
ncbi:MAG: extracellular solute-binding protein, partial [Caldisericia bacterium]|nr:extracellular solute-binding protein [Caldisericia bacterium]